MTENKALALIHTGDESGLRWIMQRYTSYVGSIVGGIIGNRLAQQDVEEVVADVFMVLWSNRTKPSEGKLKSYLAAIARSRSIDRLRRAGLEEALEYDRLEITAVGPEDEVLAREGKRILLRVLQAMGPQDREIIVRHYYLFETASAIGRSLGMTPEAVRQRLKRGRDFLRQQIEKEMRDENSISFRTDE